jgi:folate-binding protein YgfZ
MIETRTFEEVYQQARSGALILRHPAHGLLWAEGRDRLDLLNRMSTNQLDQLPVGQGRSTVLTNPVGQTIDSLKVLALEQRVILVTSPGKGDTVQDWLNGYIFFQDDVKLSPFAEGWTRWGLYGPEAGQAAEAVFKGASPSGAGAYARFEGGFAWSAEARLDPGLELLLDPDATVRATEAWPDRHAGTVEGEVFDVLRIERGVPQVGREILEDTIPLEADLWDAVSFSKGCYIGQEIIARLESRGRLAKQLCGVQLDSQVRAPADLIQDGRRIGVLTSVARSPTLGWIGLALAKPSALESEDGRVQAGTDGATGHLLPLPFEPLPA